MNKRIFIYSLVAIALLIVLEHIFEFTYIPKQVLRISLFLFIPMFYIYMIRKSNMKTEIKFEKPTFKEIKIALIVSLVLFVGTLGGYYVLDQLFGMFEASGVIKGAEQLGITRQNILVWGIYLSFVNSLIEEFFFRGVIFYTLEKKSYKLAITLSSLLWSIYHVVIFITIFQIGTVIFTLVGLFIIGVLLAFSNRFGKSFINSWIIHIIADIAIVLVVLYMYTLV